MKRHQLSVAFILLITGTSSSFSGLAAQVIGAPGSEPAIEGFGTIFTLPHIGCLTRIDPVYRAVSDLNALAGAPNQPNAQINTLARLINATAQTDASMASVRLALAFQGMAGTAALNNNASGKQLGTDAANLALMESLAQTSLQIILCAQTDPRQLVSPANVALSALSALSALAALQAQGHQPVAR